MVVSLYKPTVAEEGITIKKLNFKHKIGDDYLSNIQNLCHNTCA
jgi:hypothetical protein